MTARKVKHIESNNLGWSYDEDNKAIALCLDFTAGGKTTKIWWHTNDRLQAERLLLELWRTGYKIWGDDMELPMHFPDG